ncbi:MAG: hypothetical protein RLZZ69_318 [Cyanobacteriota bacterium]
MNKFKLIILTLSLSCCLTTLVAPSAIAQSDGKDIVIKGLPKINRSTAQFIADQLGLGNIFSGVLDFFAGIEKANDRTLDVQTPDWNDVKDTIDANDTRAKELGRQIEDRTTDSWHINQDESEEVQRTLIQDAISTSTTSTKAQETAAATLVEIEAVLQKSGALSKDSAETDVSQQILQNMSEQTGINTQLLGVIASQNVQSQKDRALSVSLQIQAARQNSIANTRARREASVANDLGISAWGAVSTPIFLYEETP